MNHDGNGDHRKTEMIKSLSNWFLFYHYHYLFNFSVYTFGMNSFYLSWLSSFTNCSHSPADYSDRNVRCVVILSGSRAVRRSTCGLRVVEPSRRGKSVGTVANINSFPPEAWKDYRWSLSVSGGRRSRWWEGDKPSGKLSGALHCFSRGRAAGCHLPPRTGRDGRAVCKDLVPAGHFGVIIVTKNTQGK